MLAVYQTGLSAESAIDEMPMVLVRKVDVDRCELALNLLLRNLRFRFDKLNNKFEEYEIPTMIEGILKQYFYLTIEELAYVFNKIIIGTYKLPYNKLDSAAVFDCIHQYDSRERLAIAERRDANKKVLLIQENSDSMKVFEGVSKKFVDDMVKKISDENGIKIESKEEIQKREQEFKNERLKVLMNKKKFIDENGNEINL